MPYSTKEVGDAVFEFAVIAAVYFGAVYFTVKVIHYAWTGIW